MAKEYVDFKLVALDGKTIIQEGYVDMSTLDDDEPLLMWYDEQGLETTQIRKNNHPFESDEFQVYEDTMLAFIADDLFFQFINDFQDENKTFERDGYILVINEGDETND